MKSTTLMIAGLLIGIFGAFLPIDGLDKGDILIAYLLDMLIASVFMVGGGICAILEDIRGKKINE